MSTMDILTAIGTFVAGCAAGGGFTFLHMNKNYTKNGQSNNTDSTIQSHNRAGGDIVGGNKNDR